MNLMIGPALLGARAGVPAAVLAANSFSIGPIQFDRPVWLLLIPPLVLGALWMARSSLSGLGSFTRWAAITLRVLVIVLLCAVLAEPQWRRESKDVAVIVVVDASDSIAAATQARIDEYLKAAGGIERRAGDRLGFITVGRDAFVQSLPTPMNTRFERTHLGTTDSTNLASGVRLAMAVRPPDAASRVVMISDGNQNVGNVLQAAEAAKAAGVPIDVLPIRYRHEGEVLVDRLVAPATARMGETINLKVVLQATRAARGRLMIMQNGEPIDLDPDGPDLGVPVALTPGLNVLTQMIKAPRSGPQQFEAIFQPATPQDDAILQNNRQLAITFVTGEGKVLVLAESEEEAAELERVLTESRIAADVRSSEQAPTSLAELNAYDAVVMVNQSAYGYSLNQQELLRQFVHDSGGGLVMIGGPNSYGAGGWIGSPLEDALPIVLDPPQKRQMPKGALVLVIHSVELPQGVYWGKKVCEAAVNALSRLDLIGINEFGAGGTRWVHPLQEVGDGSAAKRAIQNLSFGDMPDFRPSLELTYSALMRSDAGQRHAIIISDGDPAHPGDDLLQKFARSGITISTVGMATHGPAMVNNLMSISGATNGKHYQIPLGQESKLPQIFIKEAQTVRRSLIWEGPAFAPTPTNLPSEPMRGIGRPLPGLNGYVVTAEREGSFAMVTLRKGDDPILAHWQHGLGKVVAFTGDASTRWANAWMGWAQFRAFWEQHVRWAMRPGGSANVRVNTQARGEETVFTIEALDDRGERLNFATFRARIARPDGSGEDVDVRQIGPGLYEAVANTEQSGAYVLGLRYAAPIEGGVVEGSAQAAVTRPFADEFRVLEDNAPLLEQVRAMTSGRALPASPERADLYSRDGLTMPVATRPIWLTLALIAVGLFLADVAVRRVRIDPAAIAAAVRRGFRPRAARAGEQMESLRDAREKARRKLEERGRAAPEASSRGVKFEASAEALRQGAAGPAVLTTEPERPPTRPQTPPKPGERQEGMSRLLKAKKRAQDELKDD